MRGLASHRDDLSGRRASGWDAFLCQLSKDSVGLEAASPPEYSSSAPHGLCFFFGTRPRAAPFSSLNGNKHKAPRTAETGPLIGRPAAGLAPTPPSLAMHLANRPPLLLQPARKETHTGQAVTAAPPRQTILLLRACVRAACIAFSLCTADPLAFLPPEPRRAHAAAAPAALTNPVPCRCQASPHSTVACRSTTRRVARRLVPPSRREAKHDGEREHRRERAALGP